MNLQSVPQETRTPPPSLREPKLDARTIPLLFAYVQRREPHMGPSFITAPDSQFNELLPENIAWQEAPDPIRQSDFWAANNKIKPDAHMQTPSNLAIGAKEAVMDDTFHIGKLLGYLVQNKKGGSQQYAGAQLPSVIRANIQESRPTTYGSLYEIQGVVPTGNVVLASGMSYVQPSIYDPF